MPERDGELKINVEKEEDDEKQEKENKDNEEKEEGNG